MNSVQRFLLGLVVAVGCCLAVPGAHAADTMQFDRTFVLDKFGDGQVTDTVHFSAKRWAIWKQQYGDRPDMLWRDKKQELASMALVDFDLTTALVSHCGRASMLVGSHCAFSPRGSACRAKLRAP